MAIDYTKSASESIDQYNSRIASARSLASGTVGSSQSLGAPTGTSGSSGTTPTGMTLSQDLTSQFAPQQQSIMDSYNQAKSLTDQSTKDLNTATTDRYQSNIDDQNQVNSNQGKSMLESGRGFVINPGSIVAFQQQADKRIKDLRNQMNDALLNNNAVGARALSDLVVKEQEAITTARSNFLNQYFGIQNETRARAQESRDEQSFQTPEQKQADEIAKAKAIANASPYTLSAGEIRFNSDGKQVASGGPRPLSATAEAAALAQQQAGTAAQQTATQALGNINTLLNNDTYKGITGGGQNPLNALGLANGDAINNYNQLQASLKLGIRGLLKGQGAVSDYEGKILSQAASSLGRNLNNADFKKNLLKIQGVIKTNNGGATTVVVRDKAGNIIGQGDLTGPDIYEAVNAGNSVEYR